MMGDSDILFVFDQWNRADHDSNGSLSKLEVIDIYIYIDLEIDTLKL